MTGDSSWYLKIKTAHLQKWGAREGSYETGAQSACQKGLRVGPEGRGHCQLCPLPAAWPGGNLSLPFPGPGFIYLGDERVVPSGDLPPSACDTIHEREHPTACHLPVKPEISWGEGQSQRSFLLHGWSLFVCWFVFRVVLGMPFIMGKYWETLHLGYISVILPDTHCSTVRKEKTVNISCLEMISFRRAGAIFWACMDRKTSESDVRTHVPGPPLTGCEIWVWSNR